MFRYWLIALAVLLLPIALFAGAPAGLSDADSNYYEDIFSYAMDTVQPGKTYQWQTTGGSGTLLVQKEFPSKSNTTCRPYSESFIIGGQEGNANGYGCRRVGREGWCRVVQKSHETPVLSCALEKPQTDTDRKEQKIELGIQKGQEIGRGVFDSLTK